MRNTMGMFSCFLFISILLSGGMRSARDFDSFPTKTIVFPIMSVNLVPLARRILKSIYELLIVGHQITLFFNFCFFPETKNVSENRNSPFLKPPKTNTFNWLKPMLSLQSEDFLLSLQSKEFRFLFFRKKNFLENFTNLVSRLPKRVYTYLFTDCSEFSPKAMDSRPTRALYPILLCDICFVLFRQVSC